MIDAIMNAHPLFWFVVGGVIIGSILYGLYQAEAFDALRGRDPRHLPQ